MRHTRTEREREATRQTGGLSTHYSVDTETMEALGKERTTMKNVIFFNYIFTFTEDSSNVCFTNPPPK